MYETANVNAAVIPEVPFYKRQPLLMILGIIAVVAVIGLLVLFIKSFSSEKKQPPLKRFLDIEESATTYNEKVSSLTKTIESVGLDSKPFLDEIGLQDVNSVAFRCNVNPVDGKCENPSFHIVDGCCVLKPGASSFDKAALVKEFALGYIAGEVAEKTMLAIFKESGERIAKKLVQESTEYALQEATEKGMKKLVNKATGEAVEFAAEESAERMIKLMLKKVSKEMFEELIQKVLQKIVGKVIAKVVAKAVAIMARMLMYASLGPVGAVLAALDMLSTFLDLFDFEGYNLFSSNQFNLQLRNTLEYSYQKHLTEAGMEYPTLLEMSAVYQEEYKIVSESVRTSVIEDVMFTLDAESLVALILDDDTTGLDAAMEKFYTENHTTINERTFQYLNEMIPVDNREYDFTYYESFSAPGRNAVSLTKESALKWNEAHKDEWFKYINNLTQFAGDQDTKDWSVHVKNELGIDIDSPEMQAYSPPLAVAFTKYYGIHDVNATDQDENNPTMIEMELEEEVPLSGMFFSLIKECEDVRRPIRMPKPAPGEQRDADMMQTVAAGMMELQHIGGAEIDPSKYGVRFNHDKRTCKFTPDYCERMGLKYTASGAHGTSDCKLWPGQYVAELIFGTTFTRNAIRYGNDPAFAAKDIFYKYTVNGQVVSIIKNPKQWAEHKKQMIVKTGKLIESGFNSGINRAERFAKEFEKNPVNAIYQEASKNIKMVAKISDQITSAMDPFEWGAKACGKNDACKIGMKIGSALNPLTQGKTIVNGISGLDKKLGITSAFKIGSATKTIGKAIGIKSPSPPPPPPIFFQLEYTDPYGIIESHNKQIVGDPVPINPATGYLAFAELKNDKDEKYYIRLTDEYGNDVGKEDRHPTENEIIDVSDVSPHGWYFVVETD